MRIDGELEEMVGSSQKLGEPWTQLYQQGRAAGQSNLVDVRHDLLVPRFFLSGV